MAEPVLGEDLLRNIPLGHFDADAEEPTPAAFWPRPEDQGRLSTDREAIWTAEQSFQFRTAALNLPSRGVVALPADELARIWDVSTVADPLVAGVDNVPSDNPAHALSDFNHLNSRSPAERRKLREELFDLAMQRGWVLGPVLD